MTPTTRPSSPRRTTSFDLRSARRHRGRWGPLPVWPQLFGGQCGAARGGLADRQQLAEGNERHQAARTALIRDRSTNSRCDRVGRLSHPTGQAVIVALRRAQRPVLAPGVRILGRPPIIRRRSRTSSIVDRAPIAWVRWGGREPRRRRPPHRSHQAVRSQETTPSGDSTVVPNRPSHRARIRFFAKSSAVGRLRPLHAHADGVGVDDHRIDGQHVAHAGGLAHGGHDRHTEQPPAGRVVRQRSGARPRSCSTAPARRPPSRWGAARPRRPCSPPSPAWSGPCAAWSARWSRTPAIWMPLVALTSASTLASTASCRPKVSSFSTNFCSATESSSQ